MIRKVVVVSLERIHQIAVLNGSSEYSYTLQPPDGSTEPTVKHEAKDHEMGVLYQDNRIAEEVYG
jgi:hypothetical protein